MNNEKLIQKKADYSVGHSRLEKHGKSLSPAYTGGIIVFTNDAKSVATQTGRSTICTFYKDDHVGLNFQMPP